MMSQWFVKIYLRETSFSGLGFTGLMGICMTLLDGGSNTTKMP